MRTRFYSIHENEKIMNIIENVLGATSPATAVSMETIVNKGIELGATEFYPRGRKDGHPWWPRTSVMMGVGAPNAVAENEELHLHRQKMYQNSKRPKMCYWVDRTSEHAIVHRDSKASGSKTSQEPVKNVIINSPVPVGFTTLPATERFKYYEKSYPGSFALVQTISTGEIKVISRDWINKNPEKFMELYGGETI